LYAEFVDDSGEMDENEVIQEVINGLMIDVNPVEED
jgi:hypothetical protein